MDFNVYNDIEKRTKGEIYIGVVGPVRTGKSTFIKNFMDVAVMPNIKDENEVKRAMDELPQSSAGKTIMTTEPKFIPNKAVTINIGNKANINVRLIDCVGFMVDGATGHMEEDSERMVKTPWFEQSIPFSKAAEIGTEKVISDHSTIGVVITSDGSFTDLNVEDYNKALDKTVNELIIEYSKQILEKITKIKDIKNLIFSPDKNYVKNMSVSMVELSNGKVVMDFSVDESSYYDTLSEITGSKIENQLHLIRFIKELAAKKTGYDKVNSAITKVKETGYGIVMPDKEEIVLDSPELIKNGSNYGVKIKATAPSIHFVKANILTEISPIIGNEEQAKDLIEFINANEEHDDIWDTNIFGKTIGQIVEEGISSKIDNLTEDTRARMQGTVEKITNDQSKGVICILL